MSKIFKKLLDHFTLSTSNINICTHPKQSKISIFETMLGSEYIAWSY